MSGPIDAIKVGFGVDLSHLDSQLAAAKTKVDKQLPNERLIQVDVLVRPQRASIEKLHRQIQDALAPGAQQGQKAIRVAPKISIAEGSIRSFRNDIEAQFKRSSQNSAIHVPVKPVFRAQDFRREVLATLGGFLTVPIKGSWDGWAPGHQPPDSGGRGGGGGGGRGAPSPAGGSAPSGQVARSRPAPVRRAQQTAPSNVIRQAPTYGVRTDVSSTDERDYGTPPQSSAQSKARPAARTAKVTGRPAPKTTMHGPGSRDTVGRTVTPGYVEPEGGRVDISNVRSGAPVQELHGEERAEYIRNRGARQTRPEDRRPLPGEGPGAVTSTIRAPRGQAGGSLSGYLEELRRQQARRADLTKLRADPRFVQAQKLARNFGDLDPDLAQALNITLDPSAPGSYSSYMQAAGYRRTGYREWMNDLDKRNRKALRRARGFTKKDAADVDPVLLLTDAAYQAARAEDQLAMDPLAANKSGDNKLRGRGGKVGRQGGRSAGVLASESIEPGAVREILERRAQGGKGNGWKALQGEFSRAEIAQARSRINANRPPSPGEPGNPEEGGAAYLSRGEAEGIYGGQGMTRGTGVKAGTRSQVDIDIEKLNSGAMSREEFETRHGMRPSGKPAEGSSYTPRPESPYRTRPSRPWPGAQPIDPHVRQKRPPRPEQRAYARNQGYSNTGAGGFGGGAAFFEFLRNFRSTAPSAQAGPRYSSRIQKLMAMAGQVEQSPNEAAIARELLRRRGIPGFAEGGVLPGVAGRLLRDYIGTEAALPRVGSRARQELETKYLRGMRAQELRRAKPVYQQGGRSDPRWRAMADEQYLKDPFCAYCGRRTVKGALGKAGFRADHLIDTARGGGMYDPANILSSCNSCNSYKSGGRSARPLLPGQRIKMLGRAEGGSLKSTGLLMRLAQAGHQPAITIVGERGPEGIVQDPNTGEAEVIPTHKLPAWLQRAQEGRGFGKDLTGHAEGGALRFRSLRGGAYTTAAQASLQAVTAGLASSTGVGSVLRVFVTNWPPALTRPVAGLNTTAAHARPATAAAAQPNVAAGQNPPPASPPTSPPNAPGRQRVTSLSRTVARDVAERATAPLEERILAARGKVSERLQESPVRALSVTFGQIAQQLVGGRAEIQQRARVANATLSAAERARARQQANVQAASEARNRIRELRANGGSPEEIAAEQDRRASAVAAAKIEGAKAEKLTARGEERARNVLTPGQLIKTQAAGLGGIIGGTALFSAAIAAFSTIGDQIEKTMSPAVDSVLGWTQAIQRSSGAIRDNIAAQQGNVRQAAAAFAAPSGVSAAFFANQGQGLVNRGTALAAQAAASQATDITRAGGLGGFDKALFGGTGGLFGSNIATEAFGGQPGYLQEVVRRIDAARQNDRSTQAQQIGAARARSLGESTGPAIPSNVKLNDTISDLNNNLANAAKLTGDVTDGFKLVTNATDDQKKAMLDSAAAVTKQTGDVEVLNRAMDLASRGIAVTSNGQGLANLQFGTYAQQQARGQLIQDPRLLLQATQSQRNAQIQLAAIQGQNTRTQDLPADTFLENLANPLSKFGTTFSVAGQRLNENPEGQKTLENVAKYSKISADAQTKYLEIVQRGQTAAENIVSNIDAPNLTGGLANVHRAGPALTQFRQDTQQIGQIGGQIRDITDSLNLRSVNLEVAQYNEQIRLTERSLGDAKDLWAAINGAEIKTVGGLQGQNILLDRQNQLLSRRQQRLSFKSEDIGFHASDLQQQLQQLQFGLQQRQINFSKSIAGFVAPGSTPEERAARVEEAKAEADYAQKQLDLQESIAKSAREQLGIARQQAAISRQEFANQNKQQDNAFLITIKEAQRAIPDLAHQLNQLFQGRAITIDQAAAQKTIADLQKQLAPLEADAKSLLQQGIDTRDRVLQDLANLSAQTGRDMRELVNDVESAWSRGAQSYINDFLTPIESNLKQFYSTLPQTGDGRSGTSGGTGGTANGNKLNAAGGIHNVSQATRFVAGEAGNETVVVLRNPRSGMWTNGGGGGGGAQFFGGINISITGGGSSSRDEQELADRLARLVEQRINRKLAMIAR